MWRRFCTRRALARIERKIDIIMSQISDAKKVIDAIQADVAPISSSITTVLAALTALQQSASNPSTATVLSPEDQSLLDAAVSEGQALAGAFDGIAATLQTAAASTSAPAPAQGTSPTT